MKKRCETRPEERGVVLVIVLLVTVGLLIITMPFLFKLSGQYLNTDRSFKSLAALNLAEAGVERAIWELNDGSISLWEGTPVERTLTLSSFQASDGSVVGDVVITVTDPSGNNPVILSTGKVPFRNSDTIDRTLRVQVTTENEVMFGSALFAQDGITFGGNSYVDGYDSRDGDYGGHNKNLDVQIGTNAVHNGAITLQDKAEVYGDALIGMDGDPEDILILDRAKISGERLALSETKELLPIEAPQGLPYMGAIDEDKKNIEISESCEFSSINLKKKAKITITEDVILYVSGPFHMAKGTKFEVKDGARVQIYLGTSFYMENGAQFNKKVEDPTGLQIWGTESFTGDFVLDTNNELCGAIYLPQGNLHITGNVEYYGSINAKTINIDANTKLHYDIALQEIDTPYYLPYFVVKSWQEILNP